MMTVVMDLRTAPPRRSAASAVVDPRFDGLPRGPHRSTRRPATRPAARPAPRPSAVPGRSAAPRRLGAGVLVGALTMFVVALLDTVTGAQVPVLGSFAALPVPAGEQQAISLTTPPATPGTCLSWSRPDASDTRVVDCTQTHLFEQAGTVQLTDQKNLPDDGQWRQLVRERCDPVVRTYLGGRFDPDGRYRVGALKPSPAKWSQGDRELRCGLQSASRSGALYPIAGRAQEQDQSAVHDAGTCLGIDGRTIGDPVDCAGPHAVETVGVVDLGAKFADRFPPVDTQDEFLQTACTKVATGYAGGDDVITGKKLTVYWDNVTEDSWTAGTRHVNCNLAALLPDRSGFAPVTGSVRGPVTVGDTPAPPAANTPEPGVPAQVPPVTPAPAPATPSTPAPDPSPAPGSGPASHVDAPPLDGGPPPAAPPPAPELPPSPAPGLPPTDGPAPADPPVTVGSPLPTPPVAPGLTSTLVGRGGPAVPLP